MRAFEFCRATNVQDAAHQGSTGGQFIAGGTNLVDLMKYDVARPSKLIDINRLDLADITDLQEGGLRLGALASNAKTAYDPRVRARYPVLADAILAGASAQLRNVATNGGNLNQRTRCYYFYNSSTACNKREPTSGCAAIGGVTRVHAILGTSTSCIATHPSDMCVALAALEAEVRLTGVGGDRSLAMAEYHRLPGNEPWLDNHLLSGEVITSIDLPNKGFPEHYTYLKIRDRQSYAFALVSAAVVMELNQGCITMARVALGGVAHKPWRSVDAEALLTGQNAEESTFRRFANALIDGASGQGDNDFKIDLARRVIVRACSQAAMGTPQPPAEKDII